MTIRETAALFRPIRTVRAPMPATAAATAPKPRSIKEARDWDSPEVIAKHDAYKKAHNEHDAAVTQLNRTHEHIATAIQEFPSKVGLALGAHGEHGKASGEAWLHEQHEKHIGDLPETAKPFAREHLSHLIKHARIWSGVVDTAKAAVDKAHDDLFTKKA